MSDDFFSRWSRRKRDVREAERAEPRPPVAARHALEPPADAASEPAAPTEPEAPPEVVQSLPSLDALTPETDLSAFLQKEVPQSLRNAALRRMWSLDPAIRDYVGDARDYAWDWSVPDGVPGYGPLAPTDDIYATLEGMFSPLRTADADGGAHEERPEPGGASGSASEPPDAKGLSERSNAACVSASEPPDAEGSRREQDGAQEAPNGTPREPPSGTRVPAIEAPIAPQPLDVAAPEEREPLFVPARPRRHGGAAPR